MNYVPVSLRVRKVCGCRAGFRPGAREVRRVDDGPGRRGDRWVQGKGDSRVCRNPAGEGASFARTGKSSSGEPPNPPEVSDLVPLLV